MHFSFLITGKYHYAEVYRVSEDFCTGICIYVEPWQFTFNLSILGLHFCFRFGKEYDE